jgi:hypothetical protein
VVRSTLGGVARAAAECGGATVRRAGRNESDIHHLLGAVCADPMGGLPIPTPDLRGVAPVVQSNTSLITPPSRLNDVLDCSESRAASRIRTGGWVRANGGRCRFRLIRKPYMIAEMHLNGSESSAVH